MYYLILYDIEENKIRSALAKRIERYAYIRNGGLGSKVGKSIDLSFPQVGNNC